jgi:hypothetical protein
MPILDIEIIASDSVPSTLVRPAEPGRASSGRGLPVDQTQSLADAITQAFGAVTRISMGQAASHSISPLR